MLRSAARTGLLAVGALLVSAAPGSSEAKDDPVIHFLPFPAGVTYTVSQGNDQGPTHNDIYNTHAFDFSMKVGDVIVATAPGKVTFVRESTEGPTGNWRDNNVVAIRHADGTIGLYEHLKKDGAVVEVGDEVLTGDPIGYSGNTGATDLPHLHFSLRKARVKDPTVPCRFEDVDGGVPKLGDVVTSQNVATRHLVAYRSLVSALDRYALARRLGAISGALGDLADAQKIELSGPQRELVDARKRRAAILERREVEATMALADVRELQESGDIEAAVRVALTGVQDFAGTAVIKDLKRAVTALKKESGYSDAAKALVPLQNFRRKVAAALKAEAKADAALAAVKPGKKPPSAPYRAALKAYERVLKLAPAEVRADVEAHIADLASR